MRLFLIILPLLLTASCVADAPQQQRGTTPPSLAIAPPWMYTTPRVRAYPATRPNRPVAVEQPEKSAVVPQRQRTPREESTEPVDEQVDDLLGRIEWLRQELKRK